MMNAHWLSFIEGMLDAVWLVDPIDFCIVAANQPAATMLGVEHSWLLGKPVIDLTCTPEDLFFWEDVARGLSHEIQSETLLTHQDGSVLNVERRVTMMCSESTVLYIVAIRDVTRQRNAENELERLIAELRATLESSADGLLVTDLDHGIRAYNQTFAALWDMPVALLTERNDAAIYEWINQAIHTRSNKHLTSTNANLLQAAETLTLHSGRILQCVVLPQYARGQTIGKVYTYRDISQHVANEARLQLASKVFEASLNAIFITDVDHHIIAANPSCETLTGYSQAELLNLDLCDLFFLNCNEKKLNDIMVHIDAQGYWEAELWNRHKNGNTYLSVASIVRVQDPFQQTTHHLCFLKDLTDTHIAKKRIEELAYKDALTGLPNRLLLMQQIEHSIHLAKRNQTTFAVLFLDLDHFKKVNDSLGHQFGDQVLVEVSQRLKSCIREIDMPSRLGGDEFVLMLEQTDARGVEITTKRILNALAQPFLVNDVHFTVTCSIGIALYPEDGETFDDLVKNADSAMYHVKERGRSDFRFYQPQMNIGLLSRMKLDYAMRQALEHNIFRLHYQPQIDLISGRIIGAEALIRWHDEELGDIGPGQFIPVAEETGVIIPIGNWVVREAVKQAAIWHNQGRQLIVAVNVSALQFQQDGFVESIASALRDYDLPAELLELELTESILIKDAADALLRLKALSALGVKLSIDDFGTGYSSLNYLKRFPLNKLKIDRSFVQDIPDDASDMAIATAIINLSHALNLKVIAEGVETQTQKDFLTTAGCNELQGFIFAPAVSAEAFETLLDTQS